jgi:hypothetical protein
VSGAWIIQVSESLRCVKATAPFTIPGLKRVGGISASLSGRSWLILPAVASFSMLSSAPVVLL